MLFFINFSNMEDLYREQTLKKISQKDFINTIKEMYPDDKLHVADIYCNTYQTRRYIPPKLLCETLVSKKKNLLSNSRQKIRDQNTLASLVGDTEKKIDAKVKSKNEKLKTFSNFDLWDDDHDHNAFLASCSRIGSCGDSYQFNGDSFDPRINSLDSDNSDTHNLKQDSVSLTLQEKSTEKNINLVDVPDLNSFQKFNQNNYALQHKDYTCSIVYDDIELALHLSICADEITIKELKAELRAYRRQLRKLSLSNYNLYIPDIRQQHRRTVSTYFKNMDDESGDNSTVYTTNSNYYFKNLIYQNYVFKKKPYRNTG